MNKKCCNKDRIFLGNVGGLYNMLEKDCFRYVCGECGSILDIKTHNLDDEELLSLIENNEELQNTPIHIKLNEESQEYLN